MSARSLSEIVDPALLRRLSVRSDAIGLAWLAGHLALIVVLGALVARTGWGWERLPAMFALGVALMALFAPLHETTHRTPFRSNWLNRAVGYGAGFVLLLPPEWFRLFHLAHHRHTQDPARDPELLGAATLTRAGYFWKLTGLPYWTAQTRLVVGTAFGFADSPWIPVDRRRAIVTEARAFAVAYTVLIAGSLALRSTWLLEFYVAPALLGQPVLRAILMAEHGGLPPIADRLANTRTTATGRLTSWLFWNANFHAEHHLAPGVPFWALPRLHQAVAGSLAATANDYASAHRRIRAVIDAR